MTTGESLVYVDLPTLLSTVGHANKRVNLLKIDIEGYEFDVLSGKQLLHNEMKGLLRTRCV